MKVYLSHCPDYDPKSLTDSIVSIVEMAGGWRSIIPEGARVLIKPNLLSARKPEKGVTTHPEFLIAVGNTLRDAGYDIAIGDSPGGAHKGVQRVWDNTGMTYASEKLGCPLVNFEASGVHRFESNGITLHIARALDDFDAIVNLPRMKTHSLMTMTGAVKNMFGVVAGLQKSEYHKLYPKPKDFGAMLVELYSHVKPAFSIMDGIFGMEGDGPASGELRPDSQIIIASEDAVALDRVAEEFMGIEKNTWSTYLAMEKGMGSGEIEIVGGDLEALKPAEPFKLPKTASFAEYAPNFLARIVGSLIWIKPKLDADKCIKCMQCKDMCPVEAISIGEDGYPVWDYKKCVLCMCCHEICPEKAVVLKRSFLARRM